MLAWLRTIAAGVLFARAITWLLESAWAWWRGPLYGVTPWGEPTGLRITPLDRRETEAAAQREWDSWEPAATAERMADLAEYHRLTDAGLTPAANI